MIRRVLLTSPFVLAAAFPVRFTSADEPLSTTQFAVELVCGKNVPVNRQSAALLAESALKLLESSEYNSLSPTWHFQISELQEEYHRALGAEHIRVIFDHDHTSKDRSGTVRVREVIVRLGEEARHTPFPDRFVDSVFSINDNGRVVGYALYSGMKAIELWRAVTRATGGVNVCRVPTHFPDLPEKDAR